MSNLIGYARVSTNDQVGPVLREKGLWFVGIDVIGDY